MPVNLSTPETEKAHRSEPLYRAIWLLRCRVPPGGYAPTTHIRHTQHNPYPVDLPMRIAGFTATSTGYYWQITNGKHKKAHSLVGFCVLVKDHFC